jgi:hypothetical protein
LLNAQSTVTVCSMNSAPFIASIASCDVVARSVTSECAEYGGYGGSHALEESGAMQRPRVRSASSAKFLVPDINSGFMIDKYRSLFLHFVLNKRVAFDKPSAPVEWHLQVLDLSVLRKLVVHICTKSAVRNCAIPTYTGRSAAKVKTSLRSPGRSVSSELASEGC